jgi:class 3 adenylate cyclase
MDPQIRYVRSFDGTRLATISIGAGPPMLMTMPVGLGSIEQLFAIPEWRKSTETVAERFTFITYDPRGQGLSDRDDSDLSLEARVGDLAAVVEALNPPPLNLLARGTTGPAAVRYTARYPERVRRLALWAAPAHPRGMRLPKRLRTIAPLIEDDWPLYCQVMALIDFGWGDTARIASAHLTQLITPETFTKNWLMVRDHDASDDLPNIRCPTLVVYPRGFDERVSVESLRALAASIPDAVLRTSPEYALYWGGGAVDAQVVMEFFLADDDPPAPSPSGTTVILFVDIVDSTALTERMGDAAFRDRSRALDAALRDAVRQSAGAVVDAKTLGDGILATFPSASQAIAAALACAAAGGEQRLPVHVGLHAGDVIREANNVFGGAVNIAARISALAAPGEVLVTDVVRALARTSAGVTFDDRGDFELKGIAGAQRVYAVRPGESSST